MTKTLISLLCRSLLLMLLALSGVSISAKESNDDIYGVWKVTAIIGGGITSLTDAEAHKLIGKRVMINPERFEVNGEACLHPKYQRSKKDTSTYFDSIEGYVGADVSGIPFPNPVTEIETGSLPGCYLLYPIREDDLMIAIDGTFYEAVRVKKVSSESGHSRKK